MPVKSQEKRQIKGGKSMAAMRVLLGHLGKRSMQYYFTDVKQGHTVIETVSFKMIHLCVIKEE